MVSSSSSPSPPKKKAKYASSSSSYASCFDKRQATIFKKASELSILINIERLCVICYGLSGELKTWPEDIKEVQKIAKSYIELSEEKRRKRSCEKNEDKKKKVGDLPKVAYPKWESRFYNYSAELLRVLMIPSLERNYTRIHNRTDFVQKGKGKKNNMRNQEPTMNHHYHHHPQQSHQVPFFMHNYGNGHITQIPQVSASDFSQGQYMPPLPFQLMNYPYLDVGSCGSTSITQIPQVSASALNQEQSLPPLPPELMMNNPFSDVGNYSGLLGVQETRINGFQNMNTGSFGVQGSGSYGFHNINYDDFNDYDPSCIF